MPYWNGSRESRPTSARPQARDSQTAVPNPCTRQTNGRDERPAKCETRSAHRHPLAHLRTAPACPAPRARPLPNALSRQDWSSPARQRIPSHPPQEILGLDPDGTRVGVDAAGVKIPVADRSPNTQRCCRRLGCGRFQFGNLGRRRNRLLWLARECVRDTRRHQQGDERVDQRRRLGHHVLAALSADLGRLSRRLCATFSRRYRGLSATARFPVLYRSSDCVRFSDSAENSECVSDVQHSGNRPPQHEEPRTPSLYSAKPRGEGAQD